MNKKIVLIDDNKVFREISKLLILKSGLVKKDEILLFENGRKALDYILENIDNKKALPEIFFVDLNMPVMDGWKFLSLFNVLCKHHKYNPSIYILTSSVDVKDFNRAKSMSEIEGYLVKPINEADFHKALQLKLDNYTNSYL